MKARPDKNKHATSVARVGRRSIVVIVLLMAAVAIYYGWRDRAEFVFPTEHE